MTPAYGDSPYQDDFWIDDRYPNDWEGNPAYPAWHPGHPQYRRMSRWDDLGSNGEYLRSEQTKWVWMHPATDWKPWHLAGPMRGREGVALARDLEGTLQPEFEIKYSEGPYIVGAEPERVDYRKRTINFGVWIQPNANAERPSQGGPFAYRRIFDEWSRSWSPKVPGYLGSFTRTHGWRWLALLLGEASKTTLDIDPATNAAMLMHLTAHAPWPMYSKRSLTRSWEAHWSDLDEHDVCTGTIAIPNRGTWEAWPKAIIRGHGDWTMTDGESRTVKLPRFYNTDGSMMLVDTDPTRRTIVTENEPVDSMLYKYLRNSQLIDLLLKDVTSKRLPAQRRIAGGIGFENVTPPRTVAHITFTTTNPLGSATVVMPQYYLNAWS